MVNILDYDTTHNDRQICLLKNDNSYKINLYIDINIS